MANARIEIARRIAAAIALGATLTGFGETVTNVRGSQRPNSNLVDIYYDLNATDGGTYTVEVAIEGRTSEVTATTFSDNVDEGVAPGKNRHILWEAGLDWRGNKGDVMVTVTATKRSKENCDKRDMVQLWEGGPYWATKNIGADNPWDYGLYFWWGDTVGYRPSGSGLKFDVPFESSDTPTRKKSIAALLDEGWIVLQSDTCVLAPSHDAAHVKWGGGWRMPTDQELRSLRDECDCGWGTMNGESGWIARGRGAYASNIIFFPYAGRSNTYRRLIREDECYLWSSVPYASDSESHSYGFKNGFVDAVIYSRSTLFPIRPVQDGPSTSSLSEPASGSSEWFFVDTTDGALKVSDVKSKYFDGEYGGDVGSKSTFLNGVPCDIEMEILMDDYSQVDHWLVNGQAITERKFSFNVGSLPVGGRLEVVAVGKEDGVRSKPFRANFDVAEVPSFYSGLLTLHAQKHPEEVVYGTFPLEIGMELASSRAASIPALDWLPTKSVKVAPEISMRTEIGSNGNGSLRMVQVEYNEEKSKSFRGTFLEKQTRRPNGVFAEVAGVALGFNLTGGPVTATWDAKELRWKFNSVTFGVGISVKAETPPFYTPIGAYLTLSATASISAQCKISGFRSQDRLEASLKLSSYQFPAVTVTGGVGEKNTINVEGSLSGEFPIELECNNGDWMGLRYGVRGTCRFTGQFLIFKAKFYEWHSPTFWFIGDPNTSGSGGGRGVKSTRLMSSASSPEIEWQLQSRDYLKKETSRMRLMAAAPTDGVVESGGYPNPAPAMASGADGDALAYLRDNAERTSANRTELVLRTGTSNEWNAAEVVWDDGTADFMPEIAAMPDGSFVATWANAGRTFSDDVTLPEMCGAMEIAVGVRNAATGEWSCRNLTADSVLDFAPVVRVGTNGTALVAWLRNAAGSLAGSAAEPTDIMASVYANGTWSAPAVVSTGAVNGFDVAFDGENAVLAFSKDADGDLQMMDDMEIFSVRFNGSVWGEPTRLTYAGDSDGRPLVRGGAGTEFAVLWTEKGVLMETAELAVSNAVAVAAADGWMISGGCSVLRGVDGRDALVWGGVSTAGGAADAPTAMMYDPVCGAWGAPRKLLDDGRYERQLSGAVGTDGGIRIGYESSSVSTNEEGEVVFGDVELRTRYIPATCDLAVVDDGFSFASEDLADGDETFLTVKVENLGFRASTNATIAVYEGVGDEKSGLASVITNFPGGGIVAVSVPWTVDNTQSNLQFTVEIDAGGDEDEGADGNNVYIWNAGAYDVSFAGVAVRNESATRRLLTAAVSNAGLGPLQNGAKVVFRRGGESGEVLAVDEIGTVWPGTNGVYNAGFAWNMEGVAFTSAWETVCVQLFPDGVVGSALDAADMAFIQVATTLSDAVFPSLGEGATAEDVGSALSVGTDAGLTNITDVAVYEAFRQWVDSVKGVDGLTTAGAQAVKDSTRAWLSFALGADKLIGRDITSNDVHIVSFRTESTGGGQGISLTSFAFEVAIDGVDVGSGSVAEETLKANLKKVLGLEGTATLAPPAGKTVDDLFSSDNIEITFDAPIDGKARFTATPPTDAGGTFFMRAKVK